MISVDDLLTNLLAQVGPLDAVELDVGRADGCVLANDLIVVDPLPPFANSAMDGYAIRRSDLDAVDRFHVVEKLPAGRSAGRPIGAGEAALIATGARLPLGADAVVPYEQATVTGDAVTLRLPVPDHGHIRPRGEDVAVGATIGRTGDALTRALATLALAVGVTAIRVIPIPTVAILTTGDELVPAHLPLGPSHVRDVNMPLLSGALHDLGMKPRSLGHVADDPSLVRSRLAAPVEADAIVVCGGLGHGPRDVVVDAMSRGHISHLFDVAMRPGKAFAFGRAGGKPVFALPGNPGAALVAFHALVAPALRVLAGRPPHRPPIQAMLTLPLTNLGDRRHYVRATLAWDGPTLAATPTGRQGSGLVSDIVAADALIVIPESVDHAVPGDVFHIILLKPIGGS